MLSYCLLASAVSDRKSAVSFTDNPLDKLLLFLFFQDSSLASSFIKMCLWCGSLSLSYLEFSELFGFVDFCPLSNSGSF